MLSNLIPGSGVDKSSLIKLNPKQLSQLLRDNGLADALAEVFFVNGVDGQVVVDGISDDELKQMGFTGIQVRTTRSMLNKLAGNGNGLLISEIILLWGLMASVMSIDSVYYYVV